MTSATPKPRAGEHTETNALWRQQSNGPRIPSHYNEMMDHAAKLEAERDALAAQNRGLVEALAGAVRFIVRTAAHKGNMDAATLAKEEVRIMEHTSQLCSGRWTGDMVSFDLAAARALLAKHGR